MTTTTMMIFPTWRKRLRLKINPSAPRNFQKNWPTLRGSFPSQTTLTPISQIPILPAVQTNNPLTVTRTRNIRTKKEIPSKKKPEEITIDDDEEDGDLNKRGSRPYRQAFDSFLSKSKDDSESDTEEDPLKNKRKTR